MSERGSETEFPGRCTCLAERGALSGAVLVGLGVLVASHMVAIPGEDNNTFDRHFLSRRWVVEKVVRVGGGSGSDGWFHGGESSLSTGEPGAGGPSFKGKRA